LGGLFITFEGVEGAGKSARSKALCAMMAARGHRAVHTREPGGPPASERVRSILLDPALSIPARAELMLYLASRAANVELVIRPALEAGSHIICERFNDATIAYQSGGRGLPLPDVLRACRFASGGLEPDLTVLLDIDPASSLARLSLRKGGPDRIEREDVEFHRRVRASYLELAGTSDRYMIVDATLPWEVQDRMVAGRVLELIGRTAAL
jgi:dTMP kinase